MAKGITVPVVQSGLEASIEAAAKKAGPLSLSATVDPSSFKRLAQPLGRVSGLATEFEKSIAASNARVIAFGASVGIINGVQNAFASLVKTTIEVEKSLTNIAVISGKTVDELQPFSRALFEIAKNTAQSFQTASEAALEFSRQGLSLDETLKRTQDALTLTRFTTLSAAEAVDVLTAAANSFGATGITTSEILNKLVAVDTKFAVSAEDLAKGLSRAGSIAQEVGVNFDELNAIVTIAQERTARGGAVIGNAFKTIFTRIRSDETIKALQSIGIYSFDAQGRLKPVVGLLEELAGKINTLGETKRIEVLEAIASKYNINVLTALVDDLGSTTSKFREARDVSAGAQSEAYQRQIELNQTLDAVITRVTNSAAQLADTLGKIGVTDSLKSLLNFFDNILTGINDVIDSEGIGGTIAKGLISGLSGVFFKIGIPLLLAIFVKLTRDIAQFGVESLKTILGINKEVRERQALEQAVVNTLIKDQQVMASILSLSSDRRKQEEYLLSVYNRQLASLQQVQSIAAGVAPALQAAGLSATSGSIKRRAAEGYLPNAEAKDVRRGVGGASPSSKVVEIPNFSFGGGKRGTMVANTSEYIVPNYAGGNGTAIFNQDMAKEYGLPPGAKKITASGGFIPASGFVPNFEKSSLTGIGGFQGKEFPYNIEKNLTPGEAKKVRGSFEKLVMESATKNPYEDKVNVASILAGRIFESSAQGLEYIDLQENNPKPDITEGPYRIAEAKLSYQAALDDPRLAKGGEKGNKLLVPRTAKQDQNINKKLLERGVIAKKHTSIGHNFLFGKAKEIIERYKDTPREEITKGIGGFKANQVPIYASASKFTSSKASTGYIPNFAATTPEELDIYKKFPAAPFPKRDEEGKQVREYRSGFWVDKQRGVRITTDIAKNALTPQQQASLLWIGAGEVDNLKIVSAMPSDGSIGAAMLVPDPEMARQVNAKSMVGGTKTKTKEAKDVAGFVKFRAFGFGGSNVKNQMNKMAEGDAPLVNNIRESMQAAIEKEAIRVSALLKPYTFAVPDAAGFREKFKKQPGAAGAVGAAAGAAFEAAMDYAFVTKKSKASQEAIKASAGKTYDVLNFKQSRILQTAFGVDTSKKGGVEQYADFKISGERDDEFADQIILNRTFVDYAESIRKSREEAAAKNRAADGYIPNYNDPLTSVAIDKTKKLQSSGGNLQSKLNDAATRAYGKFSEKRPIKAGISRAFASATGNTPATLKFRNALQDKEGSLDSLLSRPYGFMGLQLSTAPQGARFSISDPESLRKFNNPSPTDPEASFKPALVAVADYYEPTRDEIKKGAKRDVLAPKGQYGDVSYATMFARPIDLSASQVKSPIKKASFGYVPNFAENEPLKEAISREVDAGVAPARVRVTQDGRLKNPKNPNGLAVINTRDEPNGKIPNDFRERGMRAAMASRGFVPNFADDVPRVKFAKPEKMEVAEYDDLKIAINEEIKSLKKGSITREQLSQKTKELADAYRLSEENSKKFNKAVETAAQKAQGGGGGGGGNKNIDIGKFLVLQTAIVGATSALQAFTEENSNAANAIDGVNAGLSGLATFASLATSVNLPLRILLGSLTALASAAPLLSRFFESQKDPAQKASEALAKLAKQAEKTGQQLTPETLLSAIREQRQIEKSKTETVTVSNEVRKAIDAANIKGVSDELIGSITGYLIGTNKVERREGKITGIDKNAIQSILTEATTTNVKSDNTEYAVVETATKNIDQNRAIDYIERLSEEEIQKAKNRLSNATKLEDLNEEQRRKLEQQNAIEDARQRVLSSLFNTQLNINTTYNQSLIKSNDILAALEREKKLLTESEYITAKSNEEKKKANAEFEKSRLLVIEDLKKQLGAGEKDSVLGEQAQKFFQNLDPSVLQNLVDAFETTGGNVENTNQAYIDFVKAVQASTGATDAYKNGILQSLPQLGAKGAGSIRDLIRSASEAQRTSKATRDNAVAQSDSAKANDLQSTELNNLIRATQNNRALLDKNSGVIQGTSENYNGAATYAYLVKIEQAKLVKSISDLELQNALELSTAEDKIKTDIKLTQLRNEHAAQMRTTLGVEKAAEIAALNLVEETSKRVFDLAAQAENAGLKLKTDTQILEAETNLLNAYNSSYNGSVKENDIRAKLSNALAKSTRSEQEKDAELQVQIGLIRTNWQTEKNDIGRKTALLKEQNAKIDLIDESIKLEKQLNLETEELIAARRKASAGLRQVNLEKAVQNEITSAGTTNLNEISTRIKQGEALATEGVQFGFEKQALAYVARQRLAGRTNLDLRESTNILSGRDNSIQQNLQIQRGVLLDQAETFQQIIGNQTPKLFADGMAEAMQAALNQADDLGGALRNVALNFLKSLQSAFLQNASRQIVASILPSAVPPAGRKDGGYVKGYASGGLVTGGSGYKDDVPAMLSEGEYVIRKSSVSKYGASNLQKLNSGEAPKFAAGGIFLPGIRGQTEISGYKDLTAFAKQTTTSGATDVLAGGATTAFANLEDQSSRLSAYALTREDDIINQEISSAQEQALNIVKEREAYRTQQRKEFQRQLKSTAISAALSFGLSSVMGAGAKAASAAKAAKAAEAAKNIGSAQQLFSTAPQSFLSGSDYKLPTGALPTFGSTASSILNTQAPITQSIYSNTRTRMLGSKGYPFMAYGGAVKRYNAGGPTDDIPALLMGGEYVMNRQATKKYGRQFFDSINQGRAPRFADGGNVSTAEPSFAEKAAAMSDSKADGGTNVSININVTGQSSQMQTEGETKDKGIDYKQMSKQIEQIVLKTIAEQKRAGGMLKSGR